ncbi:hypothetical protein M422DRAFT_155474 [Sphaerobolus stellatus SS14]|nr:hypothetical protein M422DRAFT_155474 [Sphaerobolus stellatus SS14]
MKFSTLILVALVRLAVAMPTYDSLIGLNEREINEFVARNGVAPIPNPPNRLPRGQDGLKLVNDPTHPFQPQTPDQLRGPCPALNTLANHGYLPRSGVARPDQIVTAVMEGRFALYDLFLVYQAFLMNGNPITNLMSIGMKTPLTGTNPPKPAQVGGLSFHGTFEGDTSMSRVDAFFGDPAAFNQTRFNDLLAFASKYGVNGTYDINAASELRHERLQDSIATNPQLVFTSPRILSAYSEAVFPTVYFVDGRLNNRQLTQEAATSFFANQRMPEDFHRQPAPVSFNVIEPMTGKLFSDHPFVPGVNQGVNNYIEMPQTPAVSDFCGIYEDIVLRVVPGQYPKPTGALKNALKKNLGFLYEAVSFEHNCTEVFPYGK